jgi:hypothetical protein
MDDDRSQSEKFKDAAPALECDEDEARWEEGRGSWRHRSPPDKADD